MQIQNKLMCENCDSNPPQPPYNYCASCRAGGIGIDDDLRAEWVEANKTIAQHKHVIAELVRELEGVEGWGELMCMAIMAEETRTDMTKRVNLLINDTQHAIARAKALEA